MREANNIQPLVLRKRDAAKFCGISPATLDRLRVKHSFARPIQLSEKSIGFKRTDLEAWLDSRPIMQQMTEFAVL